jgi:3-dehydroquinate synthase
VVEEAVAAQHGLVEDILSYVQHAREFVDLVEPPIVVPGGERVKTEPALVTAVHEAIHRAGLDRHSYVVAVGGGAVLDMVGYAAATAHRGVRLVRVPTTVLAQNDSGVGVKNGVNAFGKKNFLGTFAPPTAVLNDAKFLTTLPARDWRSGIAEAIKVALLKDPDFFGFIEAHAVALVARDMPTMMRLIHRCAELHLEHIATSGDPFEFGSARPLDLGHWSAHKLEQLSDYSLRHGEAVSIGLALDSTYARLRGLLREDSWRRVLGVLSSVGLPLYARELSEFLPQRAHPRCILQGLNEFREHLGGRLTIILPDAIGHGIEVNEIDEPTMIHSIGILESYPPV